MGSGKNATGCAAILHCRKSVLRFDKSTKITLIEHNMLSYLPRKCFIAVRSIRGMAFRGDPPPKERAYDKQTRPSDKVE